MTTTKNKTYTNGNDTWFIAEVETFNDINDGVASFGLTEAEELDTETEVHPMFLADVGEDPDEYVPLDWMMDVLTNKYNLVTVKQTDLFNNILDLLACHGFEDVSITVDGVTYN